MSVLKETFALAWNFLETKEILGVPLNVYFIGCVLIGLVVAYVEGRKKR